MMREYRPRWPKSMKPGPQRAAVITLLLIVIGPFSILLAVAGAMLSTARDWFTEAAHILEEEWRPLLRNQRR